MISLERLQSVLAQFPRLSIGLVGDLFLDRYLELDENLHELSIETGLEAYQITRIRNSPGALGTMMNNLAALGVGRMVPVTVLGDDGQAYDLSQALGADAGRSDRTSSAIRAADAHVHQAAAPRAQWGLERAEPARPAQLRRPGRRRRSKSCWPS